LARGYLCSGDIDAGDAFGVGLYSSMLNWADLLLQTLGSVSGEITGGGYTSQLLSGATWSDASGTLIFEANDATWTAMSAGINNAKFAVVWQAEKGKLLAYASLSTSSFSIASGRLLSVRTRVFELA
jgi:hypothetical protein